MYTIQRIECGEVVTEQSFEAKEAAKKYFLKLSEYPFLYPQLIVDGVYYNTGQAEKLFKIGRRNRMGGFDEQYSL